MQGMGTGMKKPLPKHQKVEYKRNEPFFVANVRCGDSDYVYIKNSHWHEDLEIAYVVKGGGIHYIDGERIEEKTDHLIITNCESVHRIDVDASKHTDPDALACIVLLVSKGFLEDNFPEYSDIWFTNERTAATPQMRDIFFQFSEYAAGEHKGSGHIYIYMKGLLLQLLYYLCDTGTVSREKHAVLSSGNQVEELKQVLRYIENHYSEPIAQADMARMFYFTPQYFARWFKKSTGVTFTEYLVYYRLLQARGDLLASDKLVRDIAMDHGFADDRSFINAFKRYFNVTPHQFRINCAKR